MGKSQSLYSLGRKLKYYIADTHTRLTTAFLLATLYSFLYRVWFIKIPGGFSWSYNVGIWTASIIEGFITGTIIYYITFLWPLKRKRIHTIDILRNKISSIHLTVRELFSVLGFPFEVSHFQPRTEDELVEKLKEIPNAIKIYFGFADTEYTNASGFMFTMLDIVYQQVFEIFIFQDVLDTKVIFLLSIVENHIAQMNRQRNNANMFRDLTAFTHQLYEIYAYSKGAMELFETKNHLAIALHMENSQRDIRRHLSK